MYTFWRFCQVSGCFIDFSMKTSIDSRGTRTSRFNLINFLNELFLISFSNLIVSQASSAKVFITFFFQRSNGWSSPRLVVTLVLYRMLQF